MASRDTWLRARASRLRKNTAHSDSVSMQTKGIRSDSWPHGQGRQCLQQQNLGVPGQPQFVSACSTAMHTHAAVGAAVRMLGPECLGMPAAVLLTPYLLSAARDLVWLPHAASPLPVALGVAPYCNFGFLPSGTLKPKDNVIFLSGSHPFSITVFTQIWSV